MSLTIIIIAVPMKEYAKNSTLTLMLIGDKNRVTIKALEEYTTTELILDTAHLIKELNTTKKEYSFTHATTNDILRIDYIAQGPEANKTWTTSILDNSNGFTRAGVERINGSIRTYCWAILGSQSQTKTGILETGTAFDA